jgi:hypothetical protein
MFHSLMLNYSWWINRKDLDGQSQFEHVRHRHRTGPT